METVQIKIEECPDNDVEETSNIFDHQNTRKLSLDHCHFRQSQLDLLNKRRSSRRLSCFGESPCNLNGFLSKIGNELSVCTTDNVNDRTTHVVATINALIEEGQLCSRSQKTQGNLRDSNYGNAETLYDSNKLSKRPRQRRKSTFALGTHGGVTLPQQHILGTRNTFQRRKSTVTLGMQDSALRQFHENQSSSKGPLIDHARTRRKSCFAFNMDRSESGNHRLELLDENSIKRLQNIINSETLKQPQRSRRSSVVKVPTFTNVRLTNVQRKLYRIYRRRRRKNHKILPKEIETTDNDDDDVENDKCEEGNSVIDNEKNILNGENSADENDNKTNNNDNGPEHNSNKDIKCNDDPEKDLCSEMVNSCTVSDACDGQTEQPRLRRSSIQTRSWEITQKLRQRRKARRQMSTDIPGE